MPVFKASFPVVMCVTAALLLLALAGAAEVCRDSGFGGEGNLVYLQYLMSFRAS